jgi:hypothetical protein
MIGCPLVDDDADGFGLERPREEMVPGVIECGHGIDIRPGTEETPMKIEAVLVGLEIGSES